MKKFMLLVFPFVLSIIAYSQQIPLRYDCSLKAKNINYFTKVAAPSIYKDRFSLQKVQTIDITATYVGNWPSEARIAFDYAISIWRHLINSPIPIHIKAEWKALGESSGTLAETWSTSFKKNFSNAPFSNVNYPVSLAEALSGTQLNGTEEEIVINVNSDMASSWYYGTDGNTHAEKYDLVSTILHEIMHGLGVTHSMEIQNNVASWGQRYINDDEKGFEQCFEKYGVVGPNSTTIYRLTNTGQYQNPSGELANALQSDNVYFDGPITKQMYLNNLPKLYAPGTFQNGSTLTHFDEDTFPAGNSNSLISPELGKAEAIHSPGELGLALLQDLGWTVNRLITILNPEPGMVYMPGQTKEIKWTDNIGGQISIDLLKLDSFGEYQYFSTIQAHSSPRGSNNTINWTIPNVEGIFKIRMVDNTFTSEGYGVSYSFIISNQAQVSTPVITPPGNNYFSLQTISISCATLGATIYYTVDNTDPSQTNGTQYSAPFTISADVVIKAKAYKSGYPESVIKTETYVFGSQMPAPTFSPESGTYLCGTHFYISWPADLECYANTTHNGTEPADPNTTPTSYFSLGDIGNNPWGEISPDYPIVYKIKARTYKRSTNTWGPLRSVQYNFVLGVRIAQVDDEITGANSFGRWNKWENGQWKDYPDMQFQRPATTIDYFLKAQQNYKENTFRKYLTWSNNAGQNYFVNHAQIPVGNATSSVLAHFKNTNNITVKNNLESSLSVNSGNFYFRDPWFIDDNSDTKGPRNRGVNPLSISMTFSTSPNITTGSIYKGVFLNQPIITGKPYYSVQAAAQQDINLGGSIGTRKFYFQNWSRDIIGGQPGAEFQDSMALQTGVVFKNQNAVVKANYKGQLLSNNSTGFSSNSQRKFISDNYGAKHLVYDSQGSVWYSKSTDNGANWSQDVKLNDDGTQAKGATTAYSSGDGYLYILYQCDQGTWGSTTPSLILCQYYYGTLRWREEVCQLSSYTYNTMAVVSAINGVALVVYKPDATSGFVSMEYLLSNGNIAQSTVRSVPGTTQYSYNPALVINEFSQPKKHMLIYHESYSTVYQKVWAVTSNFYNLVTTNVSSGSGFYTNTSPSIIDVPGGSRVCWVGSVPSTRVVFKDPGNPYMFWTFGYSVASPSINRTNDATTAYFIGWSENGSSFKIVDNHLSYSYIKTLTGLQGSAIQLSNGTTAGTMHAMTFNNAALPYALTQSSSLYSYYNLNKENAVSNIASGRAGVVMKDNAEFSFMLGDIQLNGEKIRFKQLSDTLTIPTKEIFNRVVESETFELQANSDFTYSVEYGVTDSVVAANALENNQSVIFKVELVDALSNQVITTFDNVTYSKDFLQKYNSLAYQVNTEAINTMGVKLRLVADHSGTANYFINNSFVENEIIAKKGYKLINLKEDTQIKDYALAQNYPNPFNPVTTINYQLPKDGMVTLKIYDILGNEVKMLVNEQKEKGRYTVQFDASTLASGMYVYQIKANDYVATKKMMLLK